MFCKNCGKQNDDDAKFCTSCGCNLGEEVKEEATTAEETKENTETTVAEEPEKTVSESNTDLGKIKEKASDIGNEIKEKISSVDVDELKEKASAMGSEIKEKVSNIDVDDVKNKTKSFAENEVKNYKNFKNLSLKQKIIRIAIPLFIFVIAFAIFSGDNKEEIAVQCAVAQVDKQTFGKYVEIYDPVCVDSDGKGRYIVTVTSENNGFETWWAVLVTLSSDGEKYNAIANYHGGGTSQEEWIEEYKTNPDYGWGRKSEIK